MVALIAALVLGQPPAAPLELVSATPRPDMSIWFRRTSGWTGSDCAYSIRLGPTRTLWLFGDSWIGEIQEGRRVRPRMINNAAAWQDLNDHSMRFFWDDSGPEPAALLKPDSKDHWYWPGDGAVVDGRLYLIGHVIRRTEHGPPGFQFDWVSDDLLKISNPDEPPTAWKIESRPLGRELNLGVACWAEGEHFLRLWPDPWPEAAARSTCRRGPHSSGSIGEVRG